MAGIPCLYPHPYPYQRCAKCPPLAYSHGGYIPFEVPGVPRAVHVFPNEFTHLHPQLFPDQFQPTRRHSAPMIGYEQIPRSPSSGKLFGTGSAGPKAPSSSPERESYETKGPYTNDATPKGPVPAPIFKTLAQMRKETEEANRYVEVCRQRLEEARRQLEEARRARAREPAHAHTHAPPSEIIWGRGTGDPDLAFVDKSEELGRRSSHTGKILAPVDKEKEPWQVRRQVWQRPEHAKSLYGLCPALTPASVKGVPVVRSALNYLTDCRIIWKISELPSTALWSTIWQAPAPLTVEQLDSLAVEPPEPVMHLLFGRWSRDRSEDIITVKGSETGVTLGNVLCAVYRFVSKKVMWVGDGLVEVASNQKGKDALEEISNSRSRHRSSGEGRRSSVAQAEGYVSKAQPLWHYMGEPKYFGGIRFDRSIKERLGDECKNYESLWLVEFFSTPPEPLPVQEGGRT